MLRDLGGGTERTAASVDRAAINAPSSITTIDLRKPGDVDLVNRAVAAGWDVPQHIRDQICDQFDTVLDGIQEHRFHRHVTRLLKLVKLMIKMDARNMIDQGVPKSAFRYLRKRNPDRSQRRCRAEP